MVSMISSSKTSSTISKTTSSESFRRSSHVPELVMSFSTIFCNFRGDECGKRYQSTDFITSLITVFSMESCLEAIGLINDTNGEYGSQWRELIDASFPNSLFLDPPLSTVDSPQQPTDP
ncbi:hypothetical protein ACFX11_038729 [Malus domestica]